MESSTQFKTQEHDIMEVFLERERERSVLVERVSCSMHAWYT